MERLRTGDRVREYLHGRPANIKIPVVDAGGNCLDYVTLELDQENTAKFLEAGLKQSPYSLEIWAATDQAGTVTTELRDKSDWETDGDRWKARAEGKANQGPSGARAD